MFFLDAITKYYDKRDSAKNRIYFDSPDDLFKAKGRIELVGKYACPSWLGIRSIEVVKEAI